MFKTAVDSLRFLEPIGRVPTEARLGHHLAVVGAEQQLLASPGGGRVVAEVAKAPAIPIMLVNYWERFLADLARPAPVRY